jgi:DNA polymerase III delta prime subunit
MDLRPHITLDRLSHAYIIEGDRESGLSALRMLIESFGIATKANPDYHEYEFETMFIDDAHALRREQSMHGADGAKKIFIIAFNGITGESQNALLKTLEEPTLGTHLFFLVRTSAILLETVRSRMQLVRGVDIPKSSTDVFAQKFLAGTVSERMKMIERMTKVKTDEKTKAKEEARSFVSALEEPVYAMLSKGRRDVVMALEDIITTKHELSGRSPSVKQLLEFLALTLPRIESQK